MFTTGSKLFFGATALSVVGAVVFAASNGGPTGIMGTVGLLSLAVVFGFLGGVNYANRDGNVPSMEQGAEYTSAAAQPPVGRSMWPLVAAVGVAGLVVGVVSKPVVFKVAIVAVLAATVEWMVQGWSERASGDAAYNASIRKRILHPLEFPILGAVGLVAIVYAFSRIMLTTSKDVGKVVFIALGALILFGGFVFAARRNNLSKSTVAGVCSVAVVALLGAGVASAVQGQRHIEAHPTSSDDPIVCLEPGLDSEIDGEASQDVSLKSNVVANVYLQKDGDLIAFINGYPNQEFHEITVPRSAFVGVIFHNETGVPQRLTARLGTFGVGNTVETVKCTTAVNSGKSAFLEIKIPKSSAASATPVVLQVPGNEAQVIEIVVP
ncbi:MAG: hypothetical protein ABMA25_09385 [Ilumatobacteraceae bacterium]